MFRLTVKNPGHFLFSFFVFFPRYFISCLFQSRGLDVVYLQGDKGRQEKQIMHCTITTQTLPTLLFCSMTTQLILSGSRWLTRNNVATELLQVIQLTLFFCLFVFLIGGILCNLRFLQFDETCCDNLMQTPPIEGELA